MMKELYYLPVAQEMLIAAIAAIQHHIDYKLRDGHDFEIVLSNPSPENHWLMKTLVEYRPQIKVYANGPVVKPVRGEFEVVHDMTNIDKMYEYAEPAKKHLATAYGILIGADPDGVPNFSMFKPQDPMVDVLVLVGLETSPPDLVDWVFEIASDKKSVGSFQQTSKYLTESQFRTILCGDMVVGLRSAATYLAVAMGRPVVELYPSYYHKDFLGKFYSESYSMIYGQKFFTKEHVQRAMEMLWAIQATSRGSKIPMEHTTYTAENVAGSWPVDLIHK